MVSPQIQYELQLAGISFLTGVWLMVIYDGLRIIRLLTVHGSLATGLEDLAYWIYSGLLTFSMLYNENDGMLRAYAIAGIFAGMLLYDRLVSRYCLKFLKKVIKSITMKMRKCRQGWQTRK